MDHLFAFVFLLASLFLSAAGKSGYFVLTQDRQVRDTPLQRFRRQANSGIQIETFRVVSFVTSRYSRVKLTSLVRNNEDSAREVAIEMEIPKNAFISNFSMLIDDVTYVGVVKDKAAARKQYNAAVSQGQSAGLVTAKSQDIQTFDVSVNVAAGNTVTFELSYQELLIRRLGLYNQLIYIKPGQVVKDLSVEVHISEPSGLRSVEASPPTVDARGSDFVGGQTVDIRRTETQALIKYNPSVQEQRAFLQKKVISFAVTYDVTRVELGGEILIRDGYFVHFFAPATAFPVIPKNVVFIIDRSGSMRGKKIQQTKEAFITILDDLKMTDRFNIITFASTARVWRPNRMMEVTGRTVNEAKNFVRAITAGGGTNFHDATLDGVSLLETVTNNVANNLEEASMIIMLSDGDPTSGPVIDTKLIRQNVTRKIAGRYSLFSLGFGADLDYSFLQKLARENKGLARQIFITADAALQVKGFYDEVASPLLANVIVRYSGKDAKDVTRLKFDNFFQGSEILVTGRIEEKNEKTKQKSFLSRVQGKSATGKVLLETVGKPIDDSFVDDSFDMERLWAYLTIKDLLQNKTYVERSDQATIQEIDRRILQLSLRYNFVTPLTSMVVTKPQSNLTTPSPASIPNLILDWINNHPSARGYRTASGRSSFVGLSSSSFGSGSRTYQAFSSSSSSGSRRNSNRILSRRVGARARTSTVGRFSRISPPRSVGVVGSRRFLFSPTYPVVTTTPNFNYLLAAFQRYQATNPTGTKKPLINTATTTSRSTTTTTPMSTTASSTTTTPMSTTASSTTTTPMSTTASSTMSTTASSTTTTPMSTTASTTTTTPMSTTASSTTTTPMSTTASTTTITPVAATNPANTTAPIPISTSVATIQTMLQSTNPFSRTMDLTERTCSQNLTLRHAANISSPGFPGLYPASANCVWRISLDKESVNSTMRMQFISLDMEGNSCTRDRVAVYSDVRKRNRSSVKPKVFCNYHKNTDRVDAENDFLIVFQSDEIVQGRGFLINLQVL